MVSESWLTGMADEMSKRCMSKASRNSLHISELYSPEVFVSNVVVTNEITKCFIPDAKKHIQISLALFVTCMNVANMGQNSKERLNVQCSQCKIYISRFKPPKQIGFFSNLILESNKLQYNLKRGVIIERQYLRCIISRWAAMLV